MLIVSCDEPDPLPSLSPRTVSTPFGLGADFLVEVVAAVKGVSCCPPRVGKRPHCLARSLAPLLRGFQKCVVPSLANDSNPRTTVFVRSAWDASFSAQVVIDRKSRQEVLYEGREGLAVSQNTQGRRKE